MLLRMPSDQEQTFYRPESADERAYPWFQFAQPKQNRCTHLVMKRIQSMNPNSLIINTYSALRDEVAKVLSAGKERARQQWSGKRPGPTGRLGA